MHTAICTSTSKFADNRGDPGEAHRRYTNFINARGRWTGHLFQSRFSSVAMDDDHLLAALRYVSLNPVRAGLLDDTSEEGFAALRRAEGSGRPVGAPAFVDSLERLLGRKIARRAPGRKPNAPPEVQLALGL